MIWEIPSSQLQYVPDGKGANQAVAMTKLGATVEEVEKELVWIN